MFNDGIVDHTHDKMIVAGESTVQHAGGRRPVRRTARHGCEAASVLLGNWRTGPGRGKTR